MIKIRRERKENFKKRPETIPYLPVTATITVLFFCLHGPVTLTLFELAKLDLVPGNPSKSGICWPIAADHCPERREKKTKQNRRLERVDAGAAWIYLTGTSGQKKK